MKQKKARPSAISNLARKLKIKKVLMGILLIFVLLIPLHLARIYQYMEQNQSNFCSVSLYRQDGTLIASEEGIVENSSKDSLIVYFYHIQSNKKEVADAPGDPSSDPYLSASVQINGASSIIKCFFSLDGTADYLIDENEKIYTVSSLYTRDFITSSYAAPFYSTSAPPLLYSIDNDIIMPSKIDWHYKNSEGTYVSATSSQTTEEKITYSITGGIGLSFETPPTQCTATVEDSGRTYRVSFNDLHDLSINTKNTVKLKLTAVWKQTESSSFYGTAQYDFLVRIQNPSKFSLSSQMVSPGDWILLSCSNISDPAKIRIQSDWCSQPTVSLRGSTAYALLPIPEDTKDISLEFEVSYGASKQLFQLPLKSSPIKEPLLQKSDLLHPTLLKEEMLGECQSLIQAVTTNTNTFFIPKEAFGNPMNDGFTVGYQHNDPILIGANETLSLIGTEFCSAEETPQAVASWNHGTVIKTGASPSFGNYVIIDHGCGLRILYGHLSRGSVSIGDVVKKGDAIGFTGTGGIATGNGFLIICTVNQELIRPDAIMGKVIPF